MAVDFINGIFQKIARGAHVTRNLKFSESGNKFWINPRATNRTSTTYDKDSRIGQSQSFPLSWEDSSLSDEDDKSSEPKPSALTPSIQTPSVSSNSARVKRD